MHLCDHLVNRYSCMLWVSCCRWVSQPVFGPGGWIRKFTGYWKRVVFGTQHASILELKGTLHGLYIEFNASQLLQVQTNWAQRARLH